MGVNLQQGDLNFLSEEVKRIYQSLVKPDDEDTILNKDFNAYVVFRADTDFPLVQGELRSAVHIRDSHSHTAPLNIGHVICSPQPPPIVLSSVL